MGKKNFEIPLTFLIINPKEKSEQNSTLLKKRDHNFTASFEFLKEIEITNEVNSFAVTMTFSKPDIENFSYIILQKNYPDMVILSNYVKLIVSFARKI
jgi:hypothetical protein